MTSGGKDSRSDELTEGDEVTRAELRPAAVIGHQEYWRGYFHRFVEHKGEAKAIIEQEDGHIALADAHKVKFLDVE